jgi:ribokinase
MPNRGITEVSVKKKDVIVLNSHGVGQYACCDHMPAWGETISVTNWRIEQDGGKGSNVAVALGRLGIKTAYIGKVGFDPWGDLGEMWMKDAGVDTKYLYRDASVATGTGLILLGPDGQNTIIDGDSASRALTVEEVKTALDDMQGSSILVTGFEVPEKLSLFAAKYAHKNGMKVALNPSPLPNEPMGNLDYVDYLFVNEVECKYLLNLEQSTDASDDEIINKIRDKYNCPNVIMTLGDRGSLVLGEEGCSKIQPTILQKELVINTAGAGDGYMAATVAQLIKGNSLHEATEWASKYAALTVTIMGTIPAYRPIGEVEEFIATLGK